MYLQQQSIIVQGFTMPKSSWTFSFFIPLEMKLAINFTCLSKCELDAREKKNGCRQTLTPIPVCDVTRYLQWTCAIGGYLRVGVSLHWLQCNPARHGGSCSKAYVDKFWRRSNTFCDEWQHEQTILSFQVRKRLKRSGTLWFI